MKENELQPINEPIDRFDGKFHFCSNFDENPVAYGYFIFGSNEALFQAQKDENLDTMVLFTTMTPSEAKAYGKQVKLRKNWPEIKDRIMYEGCRSKFAQNPELLQKLLATGSRKLIEGNTWGDDYWGVFKGKGQNKLGNILMDLRESFANDPRFLRESLFFARVQRQYAEFIQQRMRVSKIAIIQSAHAIGFYNVLSDYLLNRFVNADSFYENDIIGIENAFIEGKFSVEYLYQRYLQCENTADSDEELFSFLKDEFWHFDLYKFQ